MNSEVKLSENIFANITISLSNISFKCLLQLYISVSRIHESEVHIINQSFKDKLGIDYETQLRILIACEENAELRENLNEYVRVSRNHQDYDEEKLVEDISFDPPVSHLVEFWQTF